MVDVGRVEVVKPWVKGFNRLEIARRKFGLHGGSRESLETEELALGMARCADGRRLRVYVPSVTWSAWPAREAPEDIYDALTHFILPEHRSADWIVFAKIPYRDPIESRTLHFHSSPVFFEFGDAIGLIDSRYKKGGTHLFQAGSARILYRAILRYVLEGYVVIGDFRGLGDVVLAGGWALVVAGLGT